MPSSYIVVCSKTNKPQRFINSCVFWRVNVTFNCRRMRHAMNAFVISCPMKFDSFILRWLFWSCEVIDSNANISAYEWTRGQKNTKIFHRTAINCACRKQTRIVSSQCAESRTRHSTEVVIKRRKCWRTKRENFSACVAPSSPKEWKISKEDVENFIKRWSERNLVQSTGRGMKPETHFSYLT